MTISFSRVRHLAVGALHRPLALTVVAACAAAVAALTLSVPRLHAAGPKVQAAQPAPQVTEQQRAEFIKSYEALPKVNVPLDAGSAKVLVVKFNDYQCPPCRQSYYDYKPIFAQ